jgi:predicted nucleic acid-binding protein
VIGEFEAEWVRYWVVPVTEALIRDAAHFAETHVLRAYDAIHLASARLVAGDDETGVTIATWDTELERAAVREGLPSLRTRH